MTDRDSFLSRWSRRKRVAAHPPEAATAPPPPESSAAPRRGEKRGAPELRDPSRAAPNAPDPAAFDPASLPPIESITAETDIGAFLAAGVPEELTRAALRRVWASDPKIRDFVGLADYDWDFNAPGSMAGFGPIGAADAFRPGAARLVASGAAEDNAPARSEPGPEAKQAASGPGPSAPNRADQFNAIRAEDVTSQNLDRSQNRDGPSRPDDDYAAMQLEQEKPADVQSITRRKHGRALPRS